MTELEPIEVTWERARRTIDDLQHLLLLAVAAACPGPHGVVQHRDRKPPWCPRCGRDNTGIQHRAQPTDRKGNA